MVDTVNAAELNVLLVDNDAPSQGGVLQINS